MKTVVRKKSQHGSVNSLAKALQHLIYLLEAQNEAEAVKDLKIALHDIQKYPSSSPEFQGALSLLDAAFASEHELNAYRFHRSKDSWSEAEELFLASNSVYNLMRRFL